MREEVGRLLKNLQAALEEQPPSKKAKTGKRGRRFQDRRQDDLQKDLDGLQSILRTWSETRKPASERVRSTVTCPPVARRALRSLDLVVVRGLDDGTFRDASEYQQELQTAFEDLHTATKSDHPYKDAEQPLVWVPLQEEEGQSIEIDTAHHPEANSARRIRYQHARRLWRRRRRFR